MVVRAKRGALLHAHRHRLRHEDLEECFSQAALELVIRARSGSGFAGSSHIANALEQRFLSRVNDRRRAIEGRSEAQAAFELALLSSGAIGGCQEVADPCADVENQVAWRLELALIRSLVPGLSEDQRLVLASQIAGQMDCAEFCARFGWTAEKYRKVAQRGRARLRKLLDDGAGLGVSRSPGVTATSWGYAGSRGRSRGGVSRSGRPVG